MRKAKAAAPAQIKELGFTPDGGALLPGELTPTLAGNRGCAVYVALRGGGGFWFMPQSERDGVVRGEALYGGRWYPRAVRLERVERYY